MVLLEPLALALGRFRDGDDSKSSMGQGSIRGGGQMATLSQASDSKI